MTDEQSVMVIKTLDHLIQCLTDLTGNEEWQKERATSELVKAGAVLYQLKESVHMNGR